MSKKILSFITTFGLALKIRGYVRKNDNKKITCGLCANECVALDNKEQERRKKNFLNSSDFGGCMPVFCPITEKTIYRFISDEHSDSASLKFDKKTNSINWDPNLDFYYRESIKEAQISEKCVVGAWIVKNKQISK